MSIPLIESTLFEYTILEDQGPSKPIIVGGEMQLADVENANHRVYPEALWKRVIPEDKLQKKIRERRMLGELDHPGDGKTHLKEVSHVMTKAELTESKRYPGKMAVYGEYETLSAPCGKILASLHRDKIGVQVSSRGDGEVRTEGRSSIVIPESFYLETWDVVLDPSVDTDCKVIEGIQPIKSSGQAGEAIVNAIYGIIESGDYSKSDLHDYAKILGSVQYDSLSEMVKVSYLRTRHLINEESSRTRSKVSTEVHPMIPGKEGTPSPHAQEAVIGSVVESQVAERTSVLTSQVESLTAEKATLTKRLTAAESLLSETIIVAKNNEMMKNHFKKQAEAYQSTNKRLSVAKAIIEELSKQVRSLQNESKLRKAAEAFATQLVSALKESKLRNYVERLLRNESKSLADAMRPKLLKCTTRDQVNEELLSLKSILKESGRRNALPNLEEDIQDPKLGTSRRARVKTNESTESPLLEGAPEHRTVQEDHEEADQTPAYLKESLTRTTALVDRMKRR